MEVGDLVEMGEQQTLQLEAGVDLVEGEVVQTDLEAVVEVDIMGREAPATVLEEEEEEEENSKVEIVSILKMEAVGLEILRMGSVFLQLELEVLEVKGVYLVELE